MLKKIILYSTVCAASFGLFARAFGSFESDSANIYQALINYLHYQLPSLSYQNLSAYGTRVVTYRVTLGEDTYIARAYARTADHWEDIMEREVTMMQRAATLGIGPRVLHVDTVLGVVLVEFIPHADLTYGMLEDPAIVRSIAHCLSTFHKGSIFDRDRTCWVHKINRDMQQLVEKYNHTVAGPMFIEAQKIAQLCTALLEPHLVIGPCHHDLNPGNLLNVSSDQILLIDWDFSSNYDFRSDLAFFLSYLLPDMQKVFLNEYFGEQLTAHDRAVIQVFFILKLLYSGIARLRRITHARCLEILTTMSDNELNILEPTITCNRPLLAQLRYAPIGEALGLFKGACMLFHSLEIQDAIRLLNSMV